MDEATLLVVARRLVMETRAVEAYTELIDAGVETRVIKGLTLEAQLYESNESRPYCDIDLLVNPRQWERAGSVLRGIGYHPYNAGGLFEHPIHSAIFRRTDRQGGVAEVDLHHRFHQVRVSSRALWRLAGSDPVTIPVDATHVLTTPLPVTGFHLAVSILADHGGTARHVMEWQRFVSRYPEHVPSVHEVAESFRATAALDRAMAVVDGPAGSPDAPQPRPLRLDSIKASAWLAHMRRAPTVRARLRLIVEVAADRRAGYRRDA